MIVSSFPRPKVLQTVGTRLRSEYASLFRGWGLVGVQHLLGTTGSLVVELLNLGLNAEDVFILGKHYSTDKAVRDDLSRLGVNTRVNNVVGKWGGFSGEFDNCVRKVWEDVTPAALDRRWKGILILDDGGHCISGLPSELLKRLPVKGVEQTTSGVTRIGERPLVPVINVALSAIKTRIEAPLVSETIVRKIGDLLPASSVRAGVIGLGNIGGSIIRALQGRGDQVFGFDVSEGSIAGATMCRSVDELIGKAEFIFGCTGEDATGTSWIGKVTGRKVFLSCSSEDREFRGLLTWLQTQLPNTTLTSAKDIELRLPNMHISLIRGGFPVNFDQEYESVPAKDIQITRSALLGGLAQALLTEATSGYIKLNSDLQRFVVEEWIREFPSRRMTYGSELIESFGDLNWISMNSAGIEDRHFPISLFN
jgi:hypothetical protein